MSGNGIRSWIRITFSGMKNTVSDTVRNRINTENRTVLYAVPRGRTGNQIDPGLFLFYCCPGAQNRYIFNEHAARSLPPLQAAR